MNNNINYELPPIKKVGPAVLPKPKNIKIQAGRVIRLNYASSLDTEKMSSRPSLPSDFVDDIDSDESANKPSRAKVVSIPVEIESAKNYSDQYRFPKKSLKLNVQPMRTLTLNGIRNEPFVPYDPTTINFTSDGSANRPTITITTGRGTNSPTVTNSSPNGFTYNIPIQHVGSNRNFVISTQDGSIPGMINTGSSNSYIIPVKLSNSTAGRAKLTTSVENDQNNQNNFGNIFIKTNRSVQNQPKKEDEVDLLKDLLVKNLTVQNEQSCVGICTKCNQKILSAENGLKAIDSLFHIKCFVCHGCGYSLQDQHFYFMENKTFCEECYNKLLEKCSFCLRPITDRILRATGKPFHPECFNCIVCKNNLDGIPFTVDASNKIHCIDCFHEKYAPRCYICRLPITPENGMEETIRIVALDKSFHLNCYKCEDCGISLSSNADNAGGCFPLEDHIYCKNCNYHHLKNLVNAQGTGLFPTNFNNQTPRSTDL